MRIKRLDGLRGVAILLVVMAENNVVDLGWTGVELFFVLTGFFMTRILRDTRTSKCYWSRFYLKRAVRVVPLLAVVIAVNTRLIQNFSVLGLAGYFLFLGNVVNLTSYKWFTLGMLSPIAIGAQFLLLWSIAVRFFSRRNLLFITIGVLAVEPVLRHVYTPYSLNYATIFNLTPFHLDALVAGSLLALLIEDRAAIRYLAQWSRGIALVLLCAFLVVSHLLSPWFVRMSNTVSYNTISYTTIAAFYFFTVAWVLFLKEGSYAERLLAWTPLVFIGQISYGIYLFHPFINVVLKRLFHLPYGLAGEHGNRLIFAPAILVSILAATLSHRFFESPIRTWGDKRARRLALEHGDLPRTEQDAIDVSNVAA